MAGAPGPRAGALLRATCVLCRAAHPRAHSCLCFGWALSRARLCITSHPPSRKVSSAPSEGLLRSNFTDRSEIQRGTRANGRGKCGASLAARQAARRGGRRRGGPRGARAHVRAGLPTAPGSVPGARRARTPGSKAALGRPSGTMRPPRPPRRGRAAGMTVRISATDGGITHGSGSTFVARFGRERTT